MENNCAMNDPKTLLLNLLAVIPDGEKTVASGTRNLLSSTRLRQLAKDQDL